MEVELLRFPHKRIRAQVIKEYMRGRYDRAVCFSCGNAARELEAAGVNVLHIGEKGDLVPTRWFTPREIAAAFDGYFDATSGHLPTDLMITLSEAYKNYFKELPDTVYLPTGSGETLVCLKLAFPDTDFIAVYNLDKATEYDAACCLNKYVEIMASKIIFGGKTWQKVRETTHPKNAGGL